MLYGSSLVNNAVLEAVGEMRSKERVPVVTDAMNRDVEDEIVESIFLDQDAIIKLEK